MHIITAFRLVAIVITAILLYFDVVAMSEERMDPLFLPIDLEQNILSIFNGLA